MALPRQGRSGAGSASSRLGARDPRARRNAQVGLSDQDLDPQSLAMERGKVRFSGFDGIGQLPEDATLAQVVARLNLIVRKGQGA